MFKPPYPPWPSIPRSVLIEYLEEWSIPEPNTGCQLWLGECTTYGGYGRVKVEGKGGLAHVAAYEAHIGPVPKGKVVHHRCRQPCCVNPEHLEPLTPSEHTSLHMRWRLADPRWDWSSMQMRKQA